MRTPKNVIKRLAIRKGEGRTLKQMFKDIKEEDERDVSDVEDQPRPPNQSDDELSDHELAKM